MRYTPSQDQERCHSLCQQIFAQPGIRVPGVSSTDTNNPLFLGGHFRPRRFQRPGSRFQMEQSSYHGCMKDVVIERMDMIFGDISLHVCPTINFDYEFRHQKSII